MKNVNRDYLVIVNARTAKITPPREMKFFTTDVLTSNIFFQLVFEDSGDPVIGSLVNKFPENAEDYTLTLRVVKSNNEPKTIKAELLDKGSSFFVADLTADFVDIPGIYECELFIDTEINGRAERSTTDKFEYEVKKSIFYNLDGIIDTKYISIEDIATIDYVNSLAVGGVSLEGYATTNQLNNKADINHMHTDYITQTDLDNALSGIGANINLVDFVADNSISIKRKNYSIIGQYSTAEGYDTTASGDMSHAEGYFTTASNYCSHAEGNFSTANGDTSHAEGYNTKASGYVSHAEGHNTIARGNYQHVQGKYNIEDKNTYAHILGNGTKDMDTGAITRSNAHTIDWDGNAWFSGNVYVGGTSQDTNSNKLATEAYVNEVVSNVSTGGASYDDTELRGLIANKADKDHTHDIYLTSIPDEYITQTELNEAIGNIGTGSNIDTDNLVVTNSISMGRREGTSIGEKSFAVGNYVTASGVCSHAEGYNTKATGDYSHAEGINNTASGHYSHAEGGSTNATAMHSHAEGGNTTASGQYSHVEGHSNVAKGIASHAEGFATRAYAENSHAEGDNTIASSKNQHVQGKYNIEDTVSKYIHIVGNGANDAKRSNAHTLDWNGNGWYKGNIYVGGTSQDTGKKLATEEYVNNAVGSSIDLSGYVTTEAMNTALAGKSDTGHTHTDLHTHSNKDVLDSITAEKVAAWDSSTESNDNIVDLVVNNSISLGRKADTVIGIYSTAEGFETTASGTRSHAEGAYTIASGEGSHAEGFGTIASSSYQHVQGRYNIEDSAKKYAHIVGNGAEKEIDGTWQVVGANIHTLDWNGNGWYAGDLYVGGTSQDNANKVLSTADIKFTTDGKLSVTINGVTKTFTPDA